jgi:hypothetical protein
MKKYYNKMKQIHSKTLICMTVGFMIWGGLLGCSYGGRIATYELSYASQGGFLYWSIIIISTLGGGGFASVIPFLGDFLLSELKSGKKLTTSALKNLAAQPKIDITNVEDRLEKLAKLKEKGILSNDEFENEKKKILSDGSRPRS